MMTNSEIIEIEEQFTLPTYNKLPIAMVKGKGSYVYDADGNKYLDFYGGHCVTPLGHCPPAVTKAIKKQLKTLMFYSNVAYSDVRAKCGKLLSDQLPAGMGNPFFCNSGTEANETALKLARKFTGKTGIIAMEGSFHGRTLGSLAITATEKYRKPYQDVLPETTFVPFGDLEAVSAVLSENDDIAAVILEPIQSMAGMTMAPAEYYQGLRKICTENDVLLIFDEVQTGVGRCGTFSISESLDVKPDLITMAKSLGSGIPVGVTFTTDEIRETVEYGDQGTTFGGGMIAMAAVRATVKEVLKFDLMVTTGYIFAFIEKKLKNHVVAIHGQGCLIGIELDYPVASVVNDLRSAGVMCGGSGNPNVIRIMPPLNVRRKEVKKFIKIFKSILQEAV